MNFLEAIGQMLSAAIGLSEPCDRQKNKAEALELLAAIDVLQRAIEANPLFKQDHPTVRYAKYKMYEMISSVRKTLWWARSDDDE